MSRIEQGFLQRVETLPAETRQLLLAAAAEPLGDVTSFWRAVERLEIRREAAIAAESAGLIEFRARIRFRHPLVRSAVYRSASVQERQDVHRVLADVTDPEFDPDRRVWHRAQATDVPDESVAADLERSSGRAQARGGLAAAAAFLEHAMLLTPEPARRAQRGLAAAQAKRDAGALDGALELLVTVDGGPPDALRTAECQRLRGEIAFDQRRGSDAARLLLNAARRLEPLDAALARETHLAALGAAVWVNDPGGVLEAAEAARAAPTAPDPPRAVDLVLQALAIRLTDGYAAAAPRMTRALQVVREIEVGGDDIGRWLWLAGNRATGMIALDVWDFDGWRDLAARQVQLARETGAVVQLQYALNLLAGNHALAGELTAAARLMDEDRLIADATQNPPLGYSAVIIAAMRGRESEALQTIEGVAREASARGQGRLVGLASHASALLFNGLGRHDAALDAATRVFHSDLLGFGTLVSSELGEAASRTGDAALAGAALEWLTERARATPTDWAVGIENRVRALLSEGDAADRLYRQSIERLGRTRVRVELARSQLLYGEWLRRERRRVDARDQLRAAHDMFSTAGVEAFAERARRELLATGETARARTAKTRDDLTPQETQIARLAGDGLSNPEIGARLYISPRTVEWHLHKVFAKLDISSRRQLAGALPEVEPAAVPV